MLGREEACITIRDVVAAGDGESVHGAIVILEGNLHGALPDIVDAGAAIALDDFVGLH